MRQIQVPSCPCKLQVILATRAMPAGFASHLITCGLCGAPASWVTHPKAASALPQGCSLAMQGLQKEDTITSRAAGMKPSLVLCVQVSKISAAISRSGRGALSMAHPAHCFSVDMAR